MEVLLLLCLLKINTTAFIAITFTNEANKDWIVIIEKVNFYLPSPVVSICRTDRSYETLPPTTPTTGTTNE